LATNITVKFTANVFSVTSSVVEVDAAAPDHLVFKPSPPASATAGTLFSPQPVIQVLDAFGNLETLESGRMITAVRGTGTGALQGTTGISTTNGVAAFTNLSYNMAESINVQFSASGVQGTNSAAIQINPATASALVFAVQPAAATAGAPFGTQPVIRTRDAFGNNSTVGLGSSKTVSVALSSGTGLLQGTTLLDVGTSAGNGTVSFSNLRIDVAGTADQLTASASGLTSGLSAMFAVSPAPFAKMQLLVPGETAAPGTASGKTGTPNTQVTDGPFNVLVNAVDTNWNVVGSVTDTVGIISSDVTAALPPNTALVAGACSLPFIFNFAGTQTITATNLTSLTGQTGRTNTSPAITVNAAPYTAAAGGTSISADATAGTYTNLIGPVYQEVAAGNVSTGTVAVVCPSGFQFDTAGTAPTVKLEGTTGGNNHLINNAANGSNAPLSSITTSQVVFTVLSISANTTTKMTWQNLRVRPAAGTPPARSNLFVSGTAAMAGVRTNSNLGTLREIAGAANRLAINTEPSTLNTAGVAFPQQPIIGSFDQFGNLRGSANGNADNSTVVTAARLAGTSSLLGTLSTVCLNGLAGFTNLSYNVAETITVQFSAPSLQSTNSPSLQIVPAAADRLAFSQQPASGAVGSNLLTQPIVVTRDPYGNSSTVGLPGSATVSLALISGSGPLLGTTNLDIGTSAGNGSVSFTNLRVDSAGTNKELTASASGLVSATSGFFTVNKADQMITFNPLTEKTYGGPPFGLNASASSGLPVSFIVNSGPASVSNSTATITGAGSVTIRASQVGDSNYNSATPVDRSFSVAQATLSVIASNATRAYGETNPVFTGFVAGVQNHDNITASYSTTATQTSPAGTYPITPSLSDPGNKLVNYAVLISNGVLTVTAVVPAPTISSISEDQGLITLSFISQSGRQYQVLYKTSLLDSNWGSLTNLTATGPSTTIADDASVAQSRFYRVVLQ
jgi:hypothetical protein